VSVLRRSLPEKLSREQIVALYKAGPDAVVSLVEFLYEHIEELDGRVSELERQSKANSRNSSKPPSSDGLKRKLKQTRKRSGKRPGGQPGHEGTTLEMSATPHHQVIHTAEQCGGCGASIVDRPVVGYERRQVFDIPPVKVEVTEHAAEIKVCSCGAHTTAPFPDGVTHRTQYGKQVKAIVTYLKHFQLLPYERLTGLLEDLFGLSLSSGTLCRISEEASGLLVETTDRIREAIRRSAVLHCDETGMRIGKLLHWLHVAATDTLTWYLPHRKRGVAAIDEMGILAGFTGTSVHDGWASYFTYEIAHGLCNAHHLRELTFVEEEYGRPWAKEMIELLLEIKERRDRSTSTRFSQGTIKTYLARYRAIIESGLELNPSPEPTGKRGRVKKSKPLNLLERLRDHERAVLAFMYDFSVPFTNNQAELDLRMMKVQQKISGAFRSMEGAKAFCVIRSYISTVRKQGMNVIESLQDAFARKPLLTNI